MSFTYANTARRVRIGDHHLHYHDAGTGTPIVLLHGGGPGASGWSNYRRNVDALARVGRVIVPDLLGFGQSDVVAPRERMFGFHANAIRMLLDDLGLQEAHIVGNSLGGGIALKLALDSPERVRRLVLMGSGGGYPLFTTTMPEGMRLLWEYYDGDGPSMAKLKRFAQIMVFDPSQVTDELLEERYRASTRPEIVADPPIKWRGSFPAEDLWRDRLDRLPHEVLVVWGREDRVVPLDSAFMLLRQIPRARLHVFPQCGHWAQSEKADEFNALVADFLRER